MFIIGCLLSFFIVFAPRVMLILAWLFSARWDMVWNGWFLPLLGIIVALVRGRWKLIRTLGGKDELYDLGSDPRELLDRAAAAPAELRRMQAELDAQRARDRASPFWQ